MRTERPSNGRREEVGLLETLPCQRPGSPSGTSRKDRDR